MYAFPLGVFSIRNFILHLHTVAVMWIRVNIFTDLKFDDPHHG